MSSEYYREALIRLETQYSNGLEASRAAMRCGLAPFNGEALAEIVQFISDIRAILAGAPKETEAKVYTAAEDTDTTTIQHKERRFVTSRTEGYVKARYTPREKQYPPAATTGSVTADCTAPDPLRAGVERLVEKYTRFVDLSVVTVPDLMLNDIRALLDGAGEADDEGV